MAPKSERTLEEQCERITSRFDKHYARKLAEQCARNGMKPAQLVRFAAMVLIDFSALDLVSKVQRVEDEMIRFRRDFNDAVYRDEE